MTLVILGLGNDLLGDDGIGLLAARAFLPYATTGVSVRTTAQSGLYLLEELQGFDDAIVVDSVVGDHPGAIRELHGSDLPPVTVPSAHYVGLPEALALGRASGLAVPSRLRILGVEIDVAQRIGSAPSTSVASCLPGLVDAVVRIARDWGYELRTPTPQEAVPDA